MKRYFYFVLGIISLILGVIGLFVPILQGILLILAGLFFLVKSGMAPRAEHYHNKISDKLKNYKK